MVKFYFFLLTMLCLLSTESKAQQTPSTGSTLEVISIASDSLCVGANTANISFTVSDTIHIYTIDFDAAAESAGFIDITDTVLVDSIASVPIPIPANVGAGSYTAVITVTDSVNTNTAISDNFNIILYSLPTPNLTIIETSGTTNNDGSLCSGDSAILKVNGGLSYNWSNGLMGDSISVSPITNTTYTVTVTDNNQCVSTISESITVDPTPVVTPIADQIVCSNVFTTPVNFSNTMSMTGVTYNWTNNNTQGIPSVGVGGIPPFIPENTTNTLQQITFTVTPSTSTCVGDSINFNIIAKPIPTVDAIPDQTVCNGELTQTINFNSTFNVNETNYTWTNNSTITGLTANGAGSINSFTGTNSLHVPINSIVTVTPVADGCVGESKTFDIVVNPSPIASFDVFPFACVETPIALNASSSTSFATIKDYQWNFNDDNIVNKNGKLTEQIFNVANDYNIELTVIDNNNCQSSTSQLITITPPPNILVDTIVSVSNSDFEVTIQPSELTYNWNTQFFNIDTNDLIESNNSDTYTLSTNNGFSLIDTRANGLIEFTVTAENCIISRGFHLTIVRDLDENITLSAPNTFTPNSDGINDVWRIRSTVTNPNDYRITIYNRNGAEVARLNSLDAFWDGNGLSSGSYVYIVTKDSTQVKSGTITLLLN